MTKIKPIVLIFLGAGCGATIRWTLETLFNAITPVIDLGTLAANYLGCFIMGIMLGIIFTFPKLSADVRVFVVTGFLGALTTISTFSNEVISRFLVDHWLDGIFVIAAHLGGCLLCTIIGLVLWRLVVNRRI